MPLMPADRISRAPSISAPPVTRRLLTLALCVLATGNSVSAVEPTHAGLEFARVDGHELLLDLYMPPDVDDPPLIVWVHGGAWRAGTRERIPTVQLVKHGFAMASVDYRLSPVAQFPAQVHDIKAAIRFLRAHAEQYGYNAEHVVIAGASAGGHLAALVGVTNGVDELEGRIGENLTQSSRVQGIISFYGASNLQTILAQSTPFGLNVRIPALRLLLGGSPDQQPELAKLASPVTHVDPSDPPLLLIHGDQDPQMPVNQAHELRGKYKQVGRPVEFEVVHGGAHGGRGFYEEAMMDRIATYLKTGTWK